MKITDHYCPKHYKRMIRKMNMWRDNSYYIVCPIKGCRVTATEHNDGHLMAYAAGTRIKDLRFEAHSIANTKFKDKKDFYNWLKFNSKKQHIGYMSQWELIKVIKKLKNL